MSTDSVDLAKKRFAVSITEIREELVFAEEFSGQYTRTVTLSDGSTRTLELAPVIRHGEMVMELKDTGYRSFMGMIPVRTARRTNGKLSVRVYDLDDVDAARAEWRSRRLASSPVLPPETSLVSNPDFVPPGFTHGIEILNDNTTHMKFVVEVLRTHVGLSEEDSNATMLAIHTRGGALIPMPSLADAERVASQITAEAAKAGYPFICRATSNVG
jgi:ATP-dependent Clp protease adapter protein ClpS